MNHTLFPLRKILTIPLLLLGGCATIFSPGDDTIHFETSPVGAQVYINGELHGKTPLDITLDRDTFDTQSVTIKKPGYETVQFDLGKDINSTAVFNLTCIFSWGTDVATGNAIKYAPKSYLIDLKATHSPQSSLRDREINRYVLINYDELLGDISNGNGEYLDNLALLMQVAPDKRQTFYSNLNKQLPQLLKLTSPLLAIPLFEQSARLTG